MKYFIFLFASIIIFACTPEGDKGEKEKGDSNTPEMLHGTSQVDWLTFFNDDTDLDHLYIDEAIIVTADGAVYEDQATRTAYFKKIKEEIGDLQYGRVFFDTTTVRDIRYELGEWVSSNKSYYRYLSIKEAGGLRALEFYTKANLNHEVDFGEIDAARAEWMRLCNQHNAKELVEQLYTDNAIYYNHKPLITGTESISAEYSYMNNPEYSLKLVPLIVEPANKNIVFEIGQCSGSYGGKYVLIWEKDENGTWKILLDSNV